MGANDIGASVSVGANVVGANDIGAYVCPSPSWRLSRDCDAVGAYTGDNVVGASVVGA